MAKNGAIYGVISASVTPLKPDYSPDLDSIPVYLEFLARRGCHGALVLGTTGEGPSFSVEERISIMRASLRIREVFPEFKLLVGVGTPSLQETINLTGKAFEMEMDGVVVLPPYYFRRAEEEGLFLWYKTILHQAVPAGGAFYGYHIPAVSGVPLSLDLISRLLDTFPGRFTGIKDSSGDPQHAIQLGTKFGKDLAVYSGNDRLFSTALENQAAGCITAMSNLMSPTLRQLWDSFDKGQPDYTAQEKLSQARQIIDKYPPAPPLVKYLLASMFHQKYWTVRPPLIPMPELLHSQVLAEATQLLGAKSTGVAS